MLRRLLNIASIVCLVMCLALMGLWVRSYYWYEGLGGLIFPNQSLDVQPLLGKLVVIQGPTESIRGKESSWYLFSHKYPVRQHPSGWRRPFYLKLFPDSRANLLFEPSYWFLVLTSGLLAIIFRLRWPPRRFSLRTLFIAITFLAIVLGMIAWVGR
jgi:hypothetical protein